MCNSIAYFSLIQTNYLHMNLMLLWLYQLSHICIYNVIIIENLLFILISPNNNKIAIILIYCQKSVFTLSINLWRWKQKQLIIYRSNLNIIYIYDSFYINTVSLSKIIILKNKIALFILMPVYKTLCLHGNI